MAAINRLSKASSIDEGDLFVVELALAQEKVSAARLLDFMTDNFVPPRGPRRIYDRQAVTVADGGDIAVIDTSNDVWLFVETVGGANIAAATFTFPLQPVDQQFVTVEWLGGDITAITFVPGAAGVSVLTAITGIVTGPAITMSEFVYDADRSSWISTT